MNKAGILFLFPAYRQMTTSSLVGRSLVGSPVSNEYIKYLSNINGRMV